MEKNKKIQLDKKAAYDMKVAEVGDGKCRAETQTSEDARGYYKRVERKRLASDEFREGSQVHVATFRALDGRWSTCIYV